MESKKKLESNKRIIKVYSFPEEIFSKFPVERENIKIKKYNLISPLISFIKNGLS